MQKKVPCPEPLLALRRNGTFAGNPSRRALRWEQKELDRQLLDACSLGPERREEVRSLLLQGASIRATDKGGWTPLMNASFHGHVNSVFEIIRHAARALAHEEFMAYLRTRDKCSVDACGWAAMHGKHAVTDLFGRYGVR